MKPRIKRHTYIDITPVSVWRCYGDGFVGYGRTPTAAYRSWRIQHDAEQARLRAAT